jgi:hypothetical protein
MRMPRKNLRLNPTSVAAKSPIREAPAPAVPWPPRWLLAAALLLALASTAAFLCEPAKVMRLCREQFDVVTITQAARSATPATVLHWWIGPWIQREMPYYRPVTSMLYLAEWQLFHQSYLGYSLLSWLLHALNSALLCALLYRLTPGSPTRRAVIGGLAAALFTVSYWGNMGVPAQVMYWWPAQGDLLSLSFGLTALLLWDRQLTGPPDHHERRQPTIQSGGAATVFLVLAILTKEMAYVVPGMIGLLTLYRRPGAFRRVFGVTAGTAVALWLVRRLVVPGAMGFKWKGLYSLEKLYHALGGPLAPLVIARDPPLPVAALGGALLLWGGGWLLGKRQRATGKAVPLYVALLPFALCLLWAALCFQVLGGVWARVFIDPNPGWLIRGIWYWLALGWLWRGRREEPVLFAAGSTALIALPLLHHGGVHYLYWPAAGWAIVNATVLACAWQAGRRWLPAAVAGRPAPR